MEINNLLEKEKAKFLQENVLAKRHVKNDILI